MDDSGVSFDQRRLMRLVGRHWWVVALCAVLGAGIGLARVMTGGVGYTADAQVLVGDSMTVQSLSGTNPQTRDQTRLVDTELRRMQSDRIVNAVESSLPQGHASYTVRFVTGTTATNVVTVSVTSTDENVAQSVANGIADGYVKALAENNTAVIAATENQLNGAIKSLNDQLAQLEAALSSASDSGLARVQAIVGPSRSSLLDQRAALQQQLEQVTLVKSVGAAGGAQIIEAADDPEVSLVGVAMPVAIGLILGLIIGLGIVWLRESLAGKVIDGADVESTGLEPRAVWNLPLRIPVVTSESAVPVPTRSDVAALRALAATMWPSHQSTAGTTLIAPMLDDQHAEGVLAVWLARELLTLGRRTIVVTASPDVFAVVTPDGAPSVEETDALSQLKTSDQATPYPVRDLGDGLWVIDASDANGTGRVGDLEFQGMLRDLAEGYDAVLVVGPPLATASESFQVAPLVDRVLFVVRSRKTARRRLRALVTELGGYAVTVPALRHPHVVLHGTGQQRSDAREPVRARGGSPASNEPAGSLTVSESELPHPELEPSPDATQRTRRSDPPVSVPAHRGDA